MESVTKKNHEDHIANKGQNSMSPCMHKFIPMPQVMKIPAAKEAVEREWKKLETIPVWPLETVKSKKEVKEEAQQKFKHSPLCFIDGHLSSEECGVGTTMPDVQRTCCASRRYCEG